MALSKIKGTVIADDAINADRIADGTVVASDLLDNTITGAKLATDIAISTSGNITTTGALTSTGIDDNATSTAITINSSEQVGIGTASPTSKLQVEGSTTINSTGSPPLTIHHTDGNTVALAFKNNASDNHSLMFTDGDFRINYDGSEKMRIDSSGNVGIGTSSPSNLLHLTGPQNGTALQIANTSDTNGIRINSGVSGLASNSLQFLNSTGDSLLIIDGNSKSTMVGNIGPTGYRASFGDFEVKNQDGAGNPGGTLVLSNTDGSILSGQQLGNLTFASYDQSGATTTGGVASIRAIASETYGSTSGANLLFYTHPSSANNGTVDGNMSERMRIDSSGNVGIATTSPATILELASTTNNNVITFDPSNGGSNDDILGGLDIQNDGTVGRLSVRRESSTTSGYMKFETRSTGGSLTERMRITGGGYIGIGTGSPTERVEVTGSATQKVIAKTTSSNGLGGMEVWGDGSSYLKLFQFGSAYGGTTMAGLTGNDQAVIEAQAVSSLVLTTQGGTPDIVLAPARTARLTVKNGGNVGIGTTSPSNKLVVQTTSDPDEGTILVQRNSEASGAYCGYAFRTNSSDTDFAKGAIYFEADGTGYGRGDMLFCVDGGATSPNQVRPSDEKMRIDSSGNVLVGSTSAANYSLSTGNGFTVTQSSRIWAAVDGDFHIFNRTSNDGTIIQFRQAGTEEGSISVSGATVSYNGFTGTHWSRFTDNSKPTILKGTILESLDEMCDWYNLEFDVTTTTQDEDGNDVTNTHTEKVPYVLADGQSVGDVITYDWNTEKKDEDDNDIIEQVQATIVKEGDIKHVKSKVSDTVNAKNVYGVFSAYDEDGEGYNDFYVASVGSFVVRIKQGETIAKGDLLQSNGDGTAKVQTDDAVRSSSFAKVLSTTIIETYEDGSYLVPCSLMC